MQTHREPWNNIGGPAAFTPAGDFDAGASAHLFRLLAIAFLLTAPAASADELLVFAAASTTDAVKSLSTAFEVRTGHTVRCSFAGSNELARQVEAGAPADVFLSADLARVEQLKKLGKIDAWSVLLSNQLVVVVHEKSGLKLATARDLAGVTRLALADPSAVPAGIYARQWLENSKVWSAVEAKVVPTLDVRSALAAVAAGRVDAGIVYRTDAMTSPRVRIAHTVPKQEGPEISYPLATLKASKHPTLAKQFVAFLQGEVGEREFESRGFIFIPGARQASGVRRGEPPRP